MKVWPGYDKKTKAHLIMFLSFPLLQARSKEQAREREVRRGAKNEAAIDRTLEAHRKQDLEQASSM